eukprot:scaffold401_cov399-Prasinococcus_capsulatus_cf.AAC.27
MTATLPEPLSRPGRGLRGPRRGQFFGVAGGPPAAAAAAASERLAAPPPQRGGWAERAAAHWRSPAELAPPALRSCGGMGVASSGARRVSADAAPFLALDEFAAK